MIIDIILAIVGLWCALVVLSLIVGWFRKAPVTTYHRYELTDFHGERFRHRV